MDWLLFWLDGLWLPLVIFYALKTRAHGNLLKQYIRIRHLYEKGYLITGKRPRFGLVGNPLGSDRFVTIIRDSHTTCWVSYGDSKWKIQGLDLYLETVARFDVCIDEKRVTLLSDLHNITQEGKQLVFNALENMAKQEKKQFLVANTAK